MTISKIALLIGTVQLEGASNAPSEARPSVLPMPPHLFSFPSGERRVACRSELPFRAQHSFFVQRFNQAERIGHHKWMGGAEGVEEAEGGPGLAGPHKQELIAFPAPVVRPTQDNGGGGGGQNFQPHDTT